MLETIVSIVIGLFIFLIIIDVLVDMSNNSKTGQLWAFLGALVFIATMVV